MEISISKTNIYFDIKPDCPIEKIQLHKSPPCATLQIFPYFNDNYPAKTIIDIIDYFRQGNEGFKYLEDVDSKITIELYSRYKYIYTSFVIDITKTREEIIEYLIESCII